MSGSATNISPKLESAKAWAGLHPRVATGLAIGLLSVLMVWTIDQPIANWAAHGQDPAFQAFFKSITDYGKAALFIYIGVIGLLGARFLFLMAVPNPIAYLYKRIADIALYLLVTMAVSGIVIHTVKILAGRLRPKHLLQEGETGFFFYGGEWTNNSFPSGHSQTVFSVAMVVTMLFPKSGYVVLPLAGVLALSRVLVSAHYPSDVLMGSFIGVLAAVIVFERWFKRLKSPVYPPVQT